MNEPINDKATEKAIEKAPQKITACPEWGRGGSYTLDPVTGVRTLVERTDVAPVADAAPLPAVKSVKKGS